MKSNHKYAGRATSAPIVGISIDDKSLQLSSVITNNNLPEITAYQEYSLENYEILNLTIFNYLELNKKINFFLQENKLNKPIIIICLDGEHIAQNLCIEADENIINDKLGHYVWQVEKFLDHPQKINYLAGIKQETILQYKLLAINSRFNIKGLTTQIIAWYYAYQSYFNNPMPNCESIAQIKEFLVNEYSTLIGKFIRKPNKSNDKNILTSIGLYQIGKNLYEKF